MDVAGWRFEQIGGAGLRAVVCLLPQHVRLFCGYTPRLGSGVLLATADGRVRVALPQDELELAQAAGVQDLVGYEASSLQRHIELDEAITTALRRLAQDLPAGARVGFEDQPQMTPGVYVDTLQLGESFRRVLNGGLAGMELVPCVDLLRRLQSRKTDAEIALLRSACRLGEVAFAAARTAAQPGRHEYEVAAAAAGALAGSAEVPGVASGDRGGGAWVMSGPNSARAAAAFAHTGTRRLEQGDFVLVHMNPRVDGIWSDLTRTFILGEPDDRQRRILAAVFAARVEARRHLRAGVPARDVDAAARSVLAQHGLGERFTHGLGHGIGFNGISGVDAPTLAPISDDTLEAGMCFNIEPAVYIDGDGGVRHCDAVALTDGGAQELSPYLTTLEALILPA
jgi:Xaa-Pro aminopeptidase